MKEVTAYVVLKYGDTFMGAFLNIEEANSIANGEGQCQIIKSKAEQSEDGSLRLLNIKKTSGVN